MTGERIVRAAWPFLANAIVAVCTAYAAILWVIPST